MGNHLIISLGTRDIQIKKLRSEIISKQGIKVRNSVPESDFMLFNSPREAGLKLDEYFNECNDALVYPLSKPAIKYVLDNFGKVEEVILVATDQSKEEGVDPRHINNDTVEFAKVLKKLIHRDFKPQQVGKIKIAVVRGSGIIYHDKMYDYFGQNLQNIFSAESIFLSLQGGVDAINMAILLRALEFGKDVNQLSKPENANFAFPLKFPLKFKQNFQRQKLRHSIEQYNYSAVIEIATSNELKLLAEYSISRINFNYEEARKLLQKLMTEDEGNRHKYISHVGQLTFSDGFKDRQREVYLSAKLSLKHRSFSDFLAKMFSMSETLLKPLVSEILGGEIEFNSKNKHESWNSLLAKKPELVKHLDQCKYNGAPLMYSHPNRYAYQEIYFFDQGLKGVSVDENMRLLLELLNNLADLRNRAVHDLGSVSEKDINNTLKKANHNLEDLIFLTDRFFNVTGMGTFDEINEIFYGLLRK